MDPPHYPYRCTVFSDLTNVVDEYCMCYYVRISVLYK